MTTSTDTFIPIRAAFEGAGWTETVSGFTDLDLPYVRFGAPDGADPELRSYEIEALFVGAELDHRKTVEVWLNARANQRNTSGPAPSDSYLGALRGAYVKTDSLRVRAALRPVLLALREPFIERSRSVSARMRTFWEDLGFTPDEARVRWAAFGLGDVINPSVRGAMELLDPADRVLGLLRTVSLGAMPEDIDPQAVARLMLDLEELG